MMQEAFDDSLLARAQLISDVLAVTVRNSLLRDELLGWSNRVRDSWVLLSRLVSSGDTDDFFSVFAKQVAMSMPVTCCRVSLYDPEADTLRIKTDYSLRSGSRTGNRMMYEMPLAQMPYHLSVIRSGKALIASARDDLKGGMTEKEMSDGFPDKVRSAMIVPLTIDGTVRGVMSLGEARDPRRRPFGNDDLSFAQMRATQASLAMVIAENQADLKSREGIQTIDPAGAALLESLSDVNRRIAGPLSSIIGAAELLDRSAPDTGGRMTQCVRTIRRNAEKVARTLENLRQFRDAVK
jgi:hypothetical protein